jgi:hypothetical protein
LFALLTLERKIEICDVLLEMGAQDPDIVSSILNLGRIGFIIVEFRSLIAKNCLGIC